MTNKNNGNLVKEHSNRTSKVTYILTYCSIFFSSDNNCIVEDFGNLYFQEFCKIKDQSLLILLVLVSVTLKQVYTSFVTVSNRLKKKYIGFVLISVSSFKNILAISFQLL